VQEVYNTGETTLLDGRSLCLVTLVGVEDWIKTGVKHSHRYDQVCDPPDGQMKYRCLYEVEGADVSFVLVNDPDDGDGRMIQFDQANLKSRTVQGSRSTRFK
jgi:hypothetical protein